MDLIFTLLFMILSTFRSCRNFLRMAKLAEAWMMDIAHVAALAAFLASPAARRIIGAIIPVDGGQHLLAWD